MTSRDFLWPDLPLEAWEPTYQTLHMWTQIAGKIRMALHPPMNHWWHTTLYVNPRGLTTNSIPSGSGLFDIQFDFVDHRFELRASDGRLESFPLTAQPVAEFYRKVMAALQNLDIAVEINTRPQEVADPIPFEQDYTHASYDREFANRFWRILIAAEIALEKFQSRFCGKASPIHFFWGSFDLAYTRFSGRPAPSRKGVISGQAYSHEVISAGFWPGAGLGYPAFYAYAAPAPGGLEHRAVRPEAAQWNPKLGEFILAYEDVRRAESPGGALMEFLQSSYEAAATLARWDRAAFDLAETGQAAG